MLAVERIGDCLAEDLHGRPSHNLISASVQPHGADSTSPPDSSSKPLVESVLKLIRRVAREIRNAARRLQTSAAEEHGLELAFSQLLQELAWRTKIDFRIIVEGAARPLRTAVWDEFYLIGREGLVNASRHSFATKVETELRYAADYFQLLIRDNGCGIDPQTLITGRDRQWGLSEMRERAERIGAKLKVLTRVATGTEIRILIPSRIAFEPDFSDRPSGFAVRNARATSRKRVKA